MKILNKIQIKSEKLIKKEELLSLRGGYGNPCAGNACTKDTDCCPSNPNCRYPVGNPDQKFCFSP